MKFRVFSITTKLLLLYLLVGLASLTLVGTYSFYAARQAIIERTTEQLISVRAVKKQQIEFFFAEKTRNLEFLSRSKDARLLASDLSWTRNTGNTKTIIASELPGNNADDQRRIRSESPLQSLENVISYSESFGFAGVYILRDEGPRLRVFPLYQSAGATLTPMLLAKIRLLDERVLKTDSTVIVDLFKRTENDTAPVCLMGMQIGSGNPSSAVVLEVSSSEINRIMLQNNAKIGLGKSGEAYLAGPDLMMRSESRFIKHSVLNIRVNSRSSARAVKNETGVLETADYRNIPVFSAYEPLGVPGLHWIVLAEIDYAESLIPVKQIRNDIVLVSLVISVLLLGIARLISKMVTQPIIRLKDAALKAGEGDFDSRVEVQSSDEIGSLAGTFNTMIDRIREERERRLSALFDGQEMERQRVSRELHDGLGQKLVGAKLQMENCEGLDYVCLQKTFAEVKNDLASLIEETRQISNDLMPPALNELGLVNALENLCGTLRHQSNLDVEFHTHGFSEDTDNKTRVYIYRIAQEALNNSIRHSSASVISLQLFENSSNLILIAEDNGKGFEPGKNEPGGGNGLYNMRERARILGGTFNIESGPGKGTTIRIKIPRHK